MRDRDGFIGWGMATSAHTAGGRPGSAAALTISVDGTTVVRSGTQDIGTGTYTVLQQLGAGVLGLPTGQVTIHLGDTAYPPAWSSAASATVPSAGSGVVPLWPHATS